MILQRTRGDLVGSISQINDSSTDPHWCTLGDERESPHRMNSSQDLSAEPMQKNPPGRSGKTNSTVNHTSGSAKILSRESKGRGQYPIMDRLGGVVSCRKWFIFSSLERQPPRQLLPLLPHRQDNSGGSAASFHSTHKPGGYRSGY